MKNPLRALAFALGLLPALAVAQQQTLPANTVVGRLGIGPGPSQAIPFANLATQLQQVNGAAVAPLFSLASTPTVASGGFGCPASSTFSVVTTGGAGTKTVLSVSTNSSGTITAVNSIVSNGAWTVTPSALDPITPFSASCAITPTLNLSFLGPTPGDAIIMGTGKNQLVDAGAPPVLKTANAITNTLLAQMPANTVKCNPTGSAANAQDCPKPWVLVTDQPFGAKCDSSTDDTIAIQAAINSLPNDGGIVLFPVQNCKISSTLMLGNGTSSTLSTKRGVILRGMGIPNTP